MRVSCLPDGYLNTNYKQRATAYCSHYHPHLVLLSTACPASPASGCGTHSGGGGRVYRHVGSPDTESQSCRGEIERE